MHSLLLGLVTLMQRSGAFYVTEMTFDTDSAPISTCPNGMIHPPVLPFPANPMSDPATLTWHEYQIRCFYDGFLNNVVHIDAGTLFGSMLTENTEFCTEGTDGQEDCKNMRENLIHWDLARNIFDVTRITHNIVEMSGNYLRVNGTFDAKLQVAISGFLVGYEFVDEFDETWIFNDDGTWNKFIMRDDRYMGNSLKEWASTTLSSAFASGDKPVLDLLERYGHHLVVDHSQKEKYWRLDLTDTSTKMVIGFLLLWFLCAPIAVVYVAMRCCAKTKVHKYGGVSYADSSDVEASEQLK